MLKLPNATPEKSKPGVAAGGVAGACAASGNASTAAAMSDTRDTKEERRFIRMVVCERWGAAGMRSRTLGNPSDGKKLKRRDAEALRCSGRNTSAPLRLCVGFF